MSLKLRVKPIIGDEKIIEVEPTDTILNVKQKLETELENYPAAQQRLIFQGKFLTNERTVESYRMQNGCYINLVKALRSA